MFPLFVLFGVRRTYLCSIYSYYRHDGVRPMRKLPIENGNPKPCAPKYNGKLLVQLCTPKAHGDTSQPRTGAHPSWLPRMNGRPVSMGVRPMRKLPIENGNPKPCAPKYNGKLLVQLCTPKAHEDTSQPRTGAHPSLLPRMNGRPWQHPKKPGLNGNPPHPPKHGLK